MAWLWCAPCPAPSITGQDIVNTEAVWVLSLRGRLSGFNILDPVVRAEWAQADRATQSRRPTVERADREPRDHETGA